MWLKRLENVKKKKKKKGERVCTVLDGRKKKWACGRMEGGLYIYIYIMIHYHDDDNGKKKKKNLALFYWFGVPRQVGNSLGGF